MITLDEKIGRLFYDGNSIPSKSDEISQIVGDNIYSNFKVKTKTVDGKKCDVIAYYKNSKLDNISIFLDNEYLKENYTPPSDIDFRDYWTPYIEYSIYELKTVIKSFLNSKKTNFSWGQIEILTDPRDKVPYIKITYLSATTFS